jgi:hypothetical protein
MRLILLLLALAGCAHQRASETPKTPHQLGGMTVQSPNETGWKLMKMKGPALGWGKINGPPIGFATIGVQLSSPYDPKAFEDFLTERALAPDPKRYRLIETRKMTITKHGLPCVKYHTLAEDAESLQPRFYKTSGFFCPLTSSDQALHYELSERSEDRMISLEATKIGLEVFQGIKLTGPR